MTTTYHAGGLVARSLPDADPVTIADRTGTSLRIEKDSLIGIAAAHAARWPEPQLGRSIYRSLDAHLIAQQEVTRGALDEALRLRAENERLRRALEHVRSLGDGARFVAGDPLALYVTSALEGHTP